MIRTYACLFFKIITIIGPKNINLQINLKLKRLGKNNFNLEKIKDSVMVIYVQQGETIALMTNETLSIIRHCPRSFLLNQTHNNFDIVKLNNLALSLSHRNCT